MQLHNNHTLFEQAVRATAQYMQLQEIYIEKDYWVTYALYAIFHSDIGKETVFKGGTALSKCYGLIDRFSEDIDLVVIKATDETANQLKKKLKEITDVVNAIMPETEIPGITQKRGMNRKTGHSYPKMFKGSYGQVRDLVILEATWLGYFEPYRTSSVRSLVYDMMIKSGQIGIAEEYNLLPFNVQVLDTKRTICEKIMSLVRFSYTEQAFVDLGNKVRHIYDLHQMLKQLDLQEFFESSDFHAMLLRVAHDDFASYRNNNKWLLNHPNESLFFTDIAASWQQIRSVYHDTFAKLVYGELPQEQDIILTLERIKGRLGKIVWDLG